MTTLADLVTSYTRTPSATVRLNGQRCRGILSLRKTEAFGGSGISGGTVVLRNPPVTPVIGMSLSWTWGYNGQEVDSFTGEVSDILDASYPDRYTLEVKDVLWRAEKSSQVIATSPLNDITAKAAIEYILTTYGGIASGRLSIPTLSASGSAWAGSAWKLGILTPVQWGDSDTESGGTTALKACQEICACLGYWLYATAGGNITAKQMERKPSASAYRTFQRGVDLLVEGAPERRQSYDSIYNQVSVRGANTGVLGAQIYDQYQTTHPLLPSGVYRDFPFSSFLIEYVNPSEAGAASATNIAQRILNVVSRPPDVITARIKADPRLAVGTTIGIVDSGVSLSTAKNYFIYQLETTLDLARGAFDQRLTLDGGAGTTGYTTVPNPESVFSWRLMSEGLNGDAVVEVFLDGSGSLSLSGGEIVTYAWSTSTTTYGSTPNTASGVSAVFLFLASELTAEITLTVTDTTSKQGSLTQTVDLTGADTLPPIQRVLSIAFGAAWTITPDGGVTVRSETSNGDAISVGIIGAGVDERASASSAATYGLLATRGSAGAGGLRQTLDTLLSASTNLVSNSAAITSNIWQNEANPARVWFAIGTAVYRSLDGGLTKTAMAAAPASVSWIMEDPAVDNSIFLLAGANMYHATDPTVGYALLYAGPVGATARQFVRSRDGQVTWVCYAGAPSGEAAQRVETGAVADIAVTDIRTIALDKDASSLAATLYVVGADDPASLYSVDGLTGLSAVTSAQTLPSGATAQHMLADPDVDLLYIADFDSVVAGTGAVRKWFPPPSDQLLLMIAGASGQQAHMLGFGSAGVQPITLLMPSWGGSGATDKLWKYTPAAGWAGLTNPQTGWYWFGVARSIHNDDHLLMWGNNIDQNTTNQFSLSGTALRSLDGSGSPLYRSIDGGATWTAITLSTNKTRCDGPLFVAWSDSVAGEFYCAMELDTPINDEQVTFWRGSSGSSSCSAIYLSSGTRNQSTWGMTTGLNGQAVLTATTGDDDPQNFGYVASGASAYTPVGGDINIELGWLELLAYPSPGVVCRNGGDVYATADYRTAPPTNQITVSGESLAALEEAVFVGNRTGVQRITTILSGASASEEAATTGVVVGTIRPGRRLRASLAVRKTAGIDVFVYTNGVWGTIAGPSAASSGVLADYVEVVD